MSFNVAPMRQVGSVYRRNSDSSQCEQNSTLVSPTCLEFLLSAPLQRGHGAPTRRNQYQPKVVNEGAVQVPDGTLFAVSYCGGTSPQFRIGKGGGPVELF